MLPFKGEFVFGLTVDTIGFCFFDQFIKNQRQNNQIFMQANVIQEIKF